MLVVKLGGGQGLDLSRCCDDLARLHAGGQRMVVLHGGSDPATALSRALGEEPRFISTPSGVRSRYTDARTLEIFTLALAGLNKEIVARLQAASVDALGLCGVDGRVLAGRRKEAVIAVDAQGRRQVIRDDRSGNVERVNAELVRALLSLGHLPVLCPPALSPDGPINVDADRAAAAVAVALGADALVLLTNVPGVLRDRNDASSLIERIEGLEGLEGAMEHAAGRMRIKLLAAREALAGGVQRVIIGDGRVASPVSQALRGMGTVLTQVRTVSSRDEAIAAQQRGADVAAHEMKGDIHAR